MAFPNASFKIDSLNETNASQTLILVNGRAFWDLNSHLQLVPIIAFSSASGTIDSGLTSTSSIDMPSYTWFAFGVGLNYQVGDFLLAGGATFSTASLTVPSVAQVSPELAYGATTFPI